MGKSRMYQSARKHTTKQTLALQFLAHPPTTVVSGTSFTCSVRAMSATGVVNTSFNGPITVTLIGGTAPLLGTTTVNASGGISVFTLTVQEGRTGLQLRASTTTGYVQTVSNSFDSALPSSSGGGWVFPGPHAPPGVVLPMAPYQPYVGNELPGLNRYSGSGVVNSSGMSCFIAKSYCLSIAADPASPSGFCMRQRFPAANAADMGRAWAPSDWGGAAPCDVTLKSGLFQPSVNQRWKFLYVLCWRRYSTSWTQAQAPLVTETMFVPNGTTRYIMRTTTGTTSRHIVLQKNIAAPDPAPPALPNPPIWVDCDFTVNAHVGKPFRHGLVTQRAVYIVSNTANTLEVDQDIGGDYPNILCTIGVTSIVPASQGSNAGTKGAFFLRLGATLTWTGADPKNADVFTPDNSFCGAWHNYTGGNSNAPKGTLAEGPTHSYANQLTHTWDGVELNATGYPFWRTSANGGGWYAIYPNPRVIPAGYVTGDLLKEEYLIQLNTPGQANGKYRVYVNDVLMGSSDTAVMVQPWYSAADTAQGMLPNIGGSFRDVALTATNPYFNQLIQTYTYGGGARVPNSEMWQDLLAMGIAGSNNNMI